MIVSKCNVPGAGLDFLKLSANGCEWARNWRLLIRLMHLITFLASN